MSFDRSGTISIAIVLIKIKLLHYFASQEKFIVLSFLPAEHQCLFFKHVFHITGRATGFLEIMGCSWCCGAFTTLPLMTAQVWQNSYSGSKSKSNSEMEEVTLLQSTFDPRGNKTLCDLSVRPFRVIQTGARLTVTGFLCTDAHGFEWFYMGYPSFLETGRHSGLYIEDAVVSPHDHPQLFFQRLNSAVNPFLLEKVELQLQLLAESQPADLKKTKKQNKTLMTAEEENCGDAAGHNLVFFPSSFPFKYVFHALLFICLSICHLNDRVSDRPVNLSLRYILFLLAHYPLLSPTSRVTPLQKSALILSYYKYIILGFASRRNLDQASSSLHPL